MPASLNKSLYSPVISHSFYKEAYFLEQVLYLPMLVGMRGG